MDDKPDHRLNPRTVSAARELRQGQTAAERRLWRHLRDRQLEGYKFRRQFPAGRFVLDFCCPACRLAIEVDGESHAEREAYDALRSRELGEGGIRVIRFTNEDVDRRLEGVLKAILEECQRRSGTATGS